MPPLANRTAPSTMLGIAALSALAAALGDAMMLGIAFGHVSIDSSLASTQLLVGSALGLLIPVYFLGYRALADAYAFPQRGVFLFFAAIVAGGGALTHVLTGLDIHLALASGARTRLPSEAFAEPSLLMVCASASAVACLAASIFIVVTDVRMRPRSMRPIPFFNPVLGTILLTAISIPMGTAGAYLGPAAPNLAHFLFFVVGRYAIASASTRP